MERHFKKFPLIFIFVAGYFLFGADAYASTACTAHSTQREILQVNCPSSTIHHHHRTDTAVILWVPFELPETIFKVSALYANPEALISRTRFFINTGLSPPSPNV